MSAAEKLWLDSLSLDELRRYFRWVSKKRIMKGCTSTYFGVHRKPTGGTRPWRAKLRKTENKVTRILWQQDFETPEAAARAWDQVVLQHRGRCCVGDCQKSLLSCVLT